ncbi:MAG: hypothetical protein ACYDC3_16685, partial [Candidatus Binataceae bacterium]
ARIFFQSGDPENSPALINVSTRTIFIQSAVRVAAKTFENSFGAGAESARYFDNFDYVEATVAGFILGYVRLWFLELLRQLDLRKTRILSRLNDQFSEALVFASEHGPGHRAYLRERGINNPILGLTQKRFF